jgi:hypothetical protein
MPFVSNSPLFCELVYFTMNYTKSSFSGRDIGLKSDLVTVQRINSYESDQANVSK